MIKRGALSHFGVLGFGLELQEHFPSPRGHINVKRSRYYLAPAGNPQKVLIQ